MTLTSPANGAAFTAPATIGFGATAGDADGTMTRVEFYANGSLVGTDTTGPSYTFNWASVPAGTLFADGGGLRRRSGVDDVGSPAWS